jgi:hypothetical protein
MTGSGTRRQGGYSVADRTLVYLVVANQKPIHPDIVRDDLAAILEAAGYEFTIAAEDCTTQATEVPRWPKAVE